MKNDDQRHIAAEAEQAKTMDLSKQITLGALSVSVLFGLIQAIRCYAIAKHYLPLPASPFPSLHGGLFALTLFVSIMSVWGTTPNRWLRGVAVAAGIIWLISTVVILKLYFAEVDKTIAYQNSPQYAAEQAAEQAAKAKAAEKASIEKIRADERRKIEEEKIRAEVRKEEAAKQK